MNKLAEELNNTLNETQVLSMLSDYGKRMYVPKGIVVQSAEAKQKAKRFNATIGTAMAEHQAMNMNCVRKYFSEDLSVSEIFPYAPMGGVPGLRQKWQDAMVEKNPLLKGSKISLPVVCAGLTACLSVVSALFIDKNEAVVLPDLYWENYNLILDEQVQAKKVQFSFFNNGCFNLKGFDEALASVKENKLAVLMNFPNNPTGYTPTDEESDGIASILKKYAELGKQITVICDDSYFGLFFEDDVCKQSLFAKICNLHENLLAVKCDGATKEEMVWGFRVAFITYGCKGLEDRHLDALCQKTMGAVRGRLSCCTTSGQNILLKAMNDADYDKEKAEGIRTLSARYKILKKELMNYSDKKCLQPLPFNSGYFMSFVTQCNAEDLRQCLLNEYETGTICLGDHLLRIAFSGVDEVDIVPLVETLYKAAESLC